MNSSHPLVVNSPPTHQGSVLGCIVAGDTRLGEFLASIARWVAIDQIIAEVKAERDALRDAHQQRAHEFLTRRASEALRCREAVLSPKKCEILRPKWPAQLLKGTDRQGCKCWQFIRSDDPQPENRQHTPITSWVETPTGHVSTTEEIDQFSNSLARRLGLSDNWRECDAPQFETSERMRTPSRSAHTAGYEGALRPQSVYVGYWTTKVYQTTHRPKGQGPHGRNNWCPTCKQYVAMSHDGPGGIDCKDHLETVAEKHAAKLAKLKKTLAKRNVDFKRKNDAKLAAKGWVGYSPETFDKKILESRGSVMDDAIRQFEKSHSRRLNKWRVR